MNREDLPLGRAFDAYQSFLLGMKLHWTRELYPELRNRYQQLERHRDGESITPEQVSDHFANDLDYTYYAWLERHLQRMKYSGRFGLVPVHEKHREKLETWLDHDWPDELLTLDPTFEPPPYFTAIDIHQHPGGVCGDSLAGVVYERGARTTTPLLGKDLDLHYRFARVIAEYQTPSRIADLGCGFGKSTAPLCEDFANAQVLGLDISAPCLKLAAVTAATNQVTNVRYVQATAEHTGQDDDAFDLVTSTMLLHEMPPPAINAMVRESYRLLEPEGWAIHLDFLADDDPFNRFIHYGHARRNNEPYMRPLNEMDIAATFTACGFRNVAVMPFAETPQALERAGDAWRFPWAVIVGQK